MLMFQRENVAFNCRMSIIILSITLLLLNGYQPKASLLEGQIANLNFPYPCDSTEVTIQHRNKAPFYRLTDVSSSQDQAQRFNVQDIHNIDGCFLNLTIRNLVRNDEGTYISFVYKNGNLLSDDTHRIWLSIDYPPGKVTCVEDEYKGGRWMVIECTANIGSLAGKIECYQNGVWMLPLTDPLESGTILKQTILILATQPVFCCSSVLGGQKDRCECNDTALYLADGRSKEPCPPISTITPVTHIYNITDSVTITQSSLSHPFIHMTTERALVNSNWEPAALIMIVIMTTILIMFIFLVFIVAYVFVKLWGKKRTNARQSQVHKMNDLE